ncbi:MAG: hypothetical protein QW728_04745, partial [Thermoplasmata archaeon]
MYVIRSFMEVAQLSIPWLEYNTYTWGSCFGCHVQTWAINGLSAAIKAGYKVNMQYLMYLVNLTLSQQHTHCHPDPSWRVDPSSPYYGAFTHNSFSYPEISTTLASSAVALFHQAMAPYQIDDWTYRINGTDYIIRNTLDLTWTLNRSIVAAADYLIRYAQSNGRVNPQLQTIYWSYDHNSMWYNSNIMSTGNAMITIREAYRITGNMSYYNIMLMARNWLLQQSVAGQRNLEKAYLLIALINTGLDETSPIILNATHALLAQQRPDGGWAYSEGGAYSDPYTTGMALYALKQVHNSTIVEPIIRGIIYLATTQIYDCVDNSGDNYDNYCINYTSGVVEPVSVNNPIYYWNPNIPGYSPSTHFASTMWPILSLGSYAVYNISLKNNEPSAELAKNAEPGETVTYKLNLTNHGFGWSEATHVFKDTIKLVAFNPEYPNWTVTLSSEYVTLIGGQSTVIEVFVRAPKDGYPGYSAPIRIRAESVNDRKANASVITLTTLIVRYDVSISCVDKTHLIEAGGQTNYTVKIVNLGNVNDTFNIRLQPADLGPGYAAWVSRPTVALGTDVRTNWVEVTVTVSVPDNVPSGERIELVVVVTSVHDPAASDSVTTTTLISPEFFLEMTCTDNVKYVDPGNYAAYNITVRNKGNAADTVIFAVINNPKKWIVDIRASTQIAFSGPGSVTIPVYVYAPRTALAGELDEVKFSCWSLTDANINDAVSTTTIVNRICNLSITSAEKDPQDNYEPGRDPTAEWNVELTNRGNAEENVFLNCTSIPPFWDMRFCIVFGQGEKRITQLAIPPNSTMSFKIQIISPRNASAGPYFCNASVFTEDQRGGVINMSLNIRHKSAGALEVRPTNKKAAPEETVSFELIVSNLGNGPDQFLLSVSTPTNTSAKFEVSLSMSPVKLAEGEVKIVILNITAPSNATQMPYDFFISLRPFNITK